MNRLQTLFAISVTLAAGVTLAGPATRPVKRPTTVIEPANCVTAECHAGIKASAVVHGPVTQNACDSCHTLTDATKHTFAIARQKAELCTYCHQFSMAGLPVVHKPVTEGQCLACHDPHGGKTHDLTREASTTELCGRCHDSVTRGKAFVHGPVVKDACNSCHTPHGSKFANLLDVTGPDLCLACHKEFEPAIASARFQHKALDKGCVQCHDVHASNVPMDLVKPAPDLCFDCHDKLKQKIASAKVTHSAISKDRTCMNCHAAHASNVARLLSELPSTGCLKCHAKPIKTVSGGVVAGVPEVADAKLVKHGEIKDGQCSGCHDAHGSQNADLLPKPFSATIYQQFSADNYALCFSCHDVRLAQDKQTTHVTNFRNGEKNLHFIHANSGERDKNCRVCHFTHASPGDHLIRKSLKYGKWDMPIGFAQTATGGSCTPGCHGEYAYDREHAIATTLPTTGPASRPAAVVVRAEHEEIHLVAWSARDITGAAIKIPDSRHNSVLVLLSSEDAGNERILKRLRSAVPQGDASRFIVVLSGPNAVDRAKALSADKAAWPIVADADRGSAQALDVRGWPVVLLLRADGEEIARFSGEPGFLAMKLAAYLDAANGKTDGKAVQDRLTRQPVRDADLDTQASRRLRAAEILFKQDKAQETLAYLDQDAALATKPESQLLRAEALVQLKQADAAQGVLDRLATGTLDPTRVGVLRARIMIAQSRWDYAQAGLEELVSQNPGSAEAHRLLGSVYEHEQNWQKAAEQYRLAAETKR